ncbi:MAG TPA: cyclic pyranopterin monophosphate synthase MoaC [Acidiferrobacteraceae bacterium]|nr:cyclic pyranopterin monophosphate synthase MoaC [Acidiferrobacteraceae bacterium]HEX19993.1 cyclic pyranopterin monophosphate synthase MoaC [Acidiferrobacteraceae bacterium]
MSKLSHFNKKGEAHMVDVGDKAITQRRAIAQGQIRMQAETLRMITEGGHKKGDVLGIARTAGIMAAKQTANLIPLCHPLPLSAIEIDFEIDADTPAVRCRAQVQTTAQTGVEMEALTAVQISLLTIYDMCKAVDRAMSMHDICLLQKSGGKSGDWFRPNNS